MTLTTKQRQKLSRATQHIENIRSGNHTEYSPRDISHLRKCYKDLKDGNHARTTEPNVVEVFADCGFTIHKKGMEWVIAL